MPQTLFTFLSHPSKITNFIIEFYEILLSAQPSPAHRIISQLEKAGLVKAVITQNIDNLHEDAGNNQVCEIHGNAYEVFCIRCGYIEKRDKDEVKKFIEELKNKPAKRFPLIKFVLDFMGKCRDCYTRLRPNIVFFGEELPPKEIVRAKQLLKECKVFIVVGTSGGVYPAASFPYEAKQSGAFVIEINLSPSFQDIDDVFLEGKASQVFEEIFSFI